MNRQILAVSLASGFAHYWVASLNNQTIGKLSAHFLCVYLQHVIKFMMMRRVYMSFVWYQIETFQPPCLKARLRSIQHMSTV